MKRQESGAGGNGTAWLDVVCGVLKGGVLAGVCSVVFLFVCAFLLSGGFLKETCTRICVIASCGFSAAIGGLFAVKRIKNHRILVGIGVGTLLFLLLLTAGLLAYGGTVSQRQVWYVFAASLGGGVVAGSFGRKYKKKRRR